MEDNSQLPRVLSKLEEELAIRHVTEATRLKIRQNNEYVEMTARHRKEVEALSKPRAKAKT